MNKISIFRNSELPRKEANVFLGRVYAMEYGDLLKIGTSKKLKNRVRALKKQGEYSGIVIGEILFTSPHTNYKENEKQLQITFSENRIGNTELFDLNIYDFIEQVGKLIAVDDSSALFEKSEAVSSHLISVVTNRC